MKEFIKNQISDSINAQQILLNDPNFIDTVIDVSKLIIKAYRNGNKVLTAGNGGSAADAQHMVAELVNKFYFDRPGLPAMALTTDTSILTAIGNDYGYDKLFSRQIEANGRDGDIFLGFSTSGRSQNIINAVKICKEKSIITVGIIGGHECEMDTLCDYVFKVPSKETPRIQEAHTLIAHMICSVVEEALFGKGFE